jgi:S-DNA-T family DNA segregation ATPase FtsK/SpoIIIE
MEDHPLARLKRASKHSKPESRFSSEKGSELVGVVLLLVGALFALCLATYHADDPSFLHQPAEPQEVANWVGPVGANLAAATYGLLGLSAVLVPILALVAGWRRVRNRELPTIVGRGAGALVLLGALPALLQLTVKEVEWRGETIPAGGAVGHVLADTLERYLSFTGALLIFIGAAIVGVALLIQSTLGDLVGAWVKKLRDLLQQAVFAWSRHRERRSREKSRQRVVTKHLERAAGLKQARLDANAAESGESGVDADLPLRVTEKSGAAGFHVRKVRPVAKSPAAAETKQPDPVAVRPQKEIPFPKPMGDSNELPPLNLLQLDEIETSVKENELVRLGELIRQRCLEFGVEGTVAGISPGPIITVFEFQPAPGVKVSQIVNLQDDLALALKAESVRIERLPGRSTLGIEVPKSDRALIHLGHLLAQDAFRKSPSPLTVALGTTIHGEPFYADLASMPHLLVAGATGSGKSVGLQSMITSILYKATRDQVQFIFIDPKRIELGVYKNIPHLKCEVVVEPKKAANALRWAVAEMERRYRLLAEVHVRSIDFYNRAILDPEVQKRLALSENDVDLDNADLKSLPYYVIVIDELADLMLVAAAEVETSIARIAQMARAVGIHLIIATQRPSVDVLTGTIKANFPCRLSYATASRHDSRTILDQIGAEKLLGNGDMLFMPPGTSRISRLHGAFVSEQETAGLVRWLKKQGRPDLDPKVLSPPEEERSGAVGGGDDDDLFDEAARLVVAQGQASASFLQRRLRIGFSRAARLIDIMEQEGLLGPPQGSKPREVLVKPDYFTELDQARD